VPAKSAQVLTAERWFEIVEAAKPHAPIKRARAELARTLNSYPRLRLDTATLRAGQERWQHIADLATELHAALGEEWRQRRLDYVPVIDDVFKRYLLRHSRPLSRGLAEQIKTRKGQRDPDREWLYLQLLDIWINSFNGQLAASSGGTGGPCVRFVRTAMGFVLPANKVPSIETVRKIVQQLGRGEALGSYRFDPVTGAKGPWRKRPLR
jgi:hypothetical protein